MSGVKYSYTRIVRYHHPLKRSPGRDPPSFRGFAFLIHRSIHPGKGFQELSSSHDKYQAHLGYDVHQLLSLFLALEEYLKETILLG